MRPAQGDTNGRRRGREETRANGIEAQTVSQGGACLLELAGEALGRNSGGICRLKRQSDSARWQRIRDSDIPKIYRPSTWPLHAGNSQPLTQKRQECSQSSSADTTKTALCSGACLSWHRPARAARAAASGGVPQNCLHYALINAHTWQCAIGEWWSPKEVYLGQPKHGSSGG